MPNSDPVKNQSMDEILESIRRAIGESDNEQSNNSENTDHKQNENPENPESPNPNTYNAQDDREHQTPHHPENTHTITQTHEVQNQTPNATENTHNSQIEPKIIETYTHSETPTNSTSSQETKQQNAQEGQEQNEQEQNEQAHDEQKHDEQKHNDDVQNQEAQTQDNHKNDTQHAAVNQTQNTNHDHDSHQNADHHPTKTDRATFAAGASLAMKNRIKMPKINTKPFIQTDSDSNPQPEAQFTQTTAENQITQEKHGKQDNQDNYAMPNGDTIQNPQKQDSNRSNAQNHDTKNANTYDMAHALESIIHNEIKKQVGLWLETHMSEKVENIIRQEIVDRLRAK